MTHLQGLTEREAISRRQRGLGNKVRFSTGRTYLQIVRQNAFTFINTVLFSIGIVLIVLGQYGDAMVTAGLVLMNVLVGVYQEGRAKRKLEQIALLARPRATVVRDGQEQTVDPTQIVLGDLLVARSGDQFVADGRIVGGTAVEVDESLLTGESDRIRKGAGDSVYSGSFCVTGTAYYEAHNVGADSLVNQLTAQARVFRQVKTPLQRDVNYIIRILVLVVTLLGALLAISFIMHRVPFVEGVRVGAVIVALVPQGLLVMTTVTYAMGALRVAGKGALIQQTNAVESTSNVNLLCLDKTGTLTTNRITLDAIQPVGTMGEAAVRRILGEYVASTPEGSRTTEAIREACPAQARRVVADVPFSSDRKWSARAFDGRPEGVSGQRVVYVLGAPEILQPQLLLDQELGPQVEAWTSQGLRVLLFAHGPGDAPLHGDDGEPQLPPDLAPLALLSFREELRPEAQEILQHFADLGVRLKIISGDNPHTVAALARQAGFHDVGAQEQRHEIRVVSGLDLDGLDDSEFEAVAEEASIFGRITPQQKERLVRVLRRRGHYVAMIGDGVNDVLSLKQAHLGIAMQSGSQATRAVADIVLLGDSFAALPIALREGQRIINGMVDVVRLLLTRTLYVLLLVIATQIVGMAFPVTPKHNSILALLTVGIPIVLVAAWAPAGTPPRSVIRSASRFVFPAAFAVAVASLAVYLVYLGTGGDLAATRSALTTFTVLCGLVLILFVEPPTEAWVGGDEMSGDWRPTFLALGMLGLYVVILALPPLRTFFELTLLPWFHYLLLAALVAVWAVIQRTLWRRRLLERLLDLKYE